MNVDDVKDDVIPTPTEANDRLALIFARQSALLHKYHHIEQRSGLMQTHLVPVPIDSPAGQARLKDFAWRVTEEITEATAALDDHDCDDSRIRETHFIEELSDALHFLVELLILAAFDPETLYDEVERHYPMSQWGDAIGATNLRDVDRLSYHMALAAAVANARDYRVLAYQAIEFLGRAMNCLKQKPWKQSHMLTDVPHFRKRIAQTYLAFLGLCASLDGAKLSADDLYRIYYKKSEVNTFRQRSNY